MRSRIFCVRATTCALPDDIFLHFYAADLARSPDGRWWVVSDRTQIPTGAGYALANRLVTSRILPEPFRDNHVHRLAGFFREAQHTLARLAPRKPDNARVVMLTPGPHNETYFEQAYLARYLGYMLVEGQDLTVRDNRVFLKTLSGLERVDVILRRVDDDFCDPLELRNDSMLGVPGLVEALRAGNVVVANALGSRPAAKPGVHVVSARSVPASARRGIETAVGRPPGGADRNRPGNTSSKISTGWWSNRRSVPTCASRIPENH